MTKKVGIIIGSTRQGRIGPKIADWVMAGFLAHPELDPELIDLEEINLPFFSEPTIPSVAPGVSDAAVMWREKVTSFDAFVIVTPEYNAGYPAPLKNALDYMKAEWANRPMTIVSYGFSGGASAAKQLGEVLARIGAAQVEPGVKLFIGDKLNATGGIDDAHASFAEQNGELDAALHAIEVWTPPVVEA